MLDLGVAGNKAKPLIKRNNKGKNISDVFAGEHHIWPVRNDVVYFYDFDSVQLRFIWTDANGRDFDTGTNIETEMTGIPNDTVGWSWGASERRTQPYLYWGGDNTQSGAECVMLDVGAIKQKVGEDKVPDQTVIKLRGNWFGSRSDGTVTVECTAYKGGVIVKSYQLSGGSVGVSNETYVFADKDGNLPNNCWVGEVVTIGGVDYKVNMVDDSIEGITDKKIRRSFTVSGVTYPSQDGYVTINGKSYKIWNNQINYEGNIYQGSRDVINNAGNIIGGTVSVKLYKDNSYKSISTEFRFGFVAGNSEQRGQQTLQASITSSDHNAADEEFAVVNYFNKTEAGQIVSLNPITDE